MTDSDIKVKTSGYQAWLDRLYDAHENNAEKAVSEGYKYLRAEGKNAKEARAILEHDLGKIWKLDTIQRHLPDECKDQEMQAIRDKRTEKQEKRRKESYDVAQELEDMLKIPMTTDGKAVEPTIKPATIKKILDALKTQKALPPTPTGSKDPTKIDFTESKLRLEIDSLKAKLAPYSVEILYELWGKKYNFTIYVEPAKRTATLSQRKADKR